MMLRRVFLLLSLSSLSLSLSYSCGFRVSSGLIQPEAQRIRRPIFHRHIPNRSSSATTHCHHHRTNTIVVSQRNIHQKHFFQTRGGGGDGSSENDDGPDAPSVPVISFFHKLLAEALGTFLIVQMGTGAVMSAIYTQSLTNLIQIASVWAVAVTLAISTTAPISGAHLNPAVTMALAVWRNFHWNQVLPYISAQIVGAMLGSTVNYLLYQSHIQAFEATNGLVRSTAVASAKAFGEYFTGTSPPMALLAEAGGTFILTVVIFALTHPRNKDLVNNVPLWIGLTVAANICVVAPITQAGFNPARDFGPRIIAYLFGWKQVAFQGAWVYILGPILGALVGAYLVDRIIYSTKSSGGMIFRVGKLTVRLQQKVVDGIRPKNS